MAMKELRVEDALLYLDQVKVEFGDRPHIYNEFLDIMKTFKTQQIDTPGVIRRVSNLFQGNRRLVLGFNTFLPEGYKIELPADGEGPPVAVFRAPGSNVAHVLNGPTTTISAPSGPPPAAASVSGAVAASQAAQQKSPALGPQGPRVGGVLATQAAGAVPGIQRVMRPGGGIPSLGQHPPPQTTHRGSGAPPRTHSSAQSSMEPGFTSQGGQSVAQLPLPPPQSRESRPSMESAVQQQGPQTTASGTQGSPGANSQSAHDRVEGGTKGQARSIPAGANAAPHGLNRATSQQQNQGHSSQRRFDSPAPVPSNSPSAAQQQPQQAQQQQQQQSGQPLEFDHAINYVTTIKKRFATEPETYKKFLEILHTYQKEQRGIKEVLDEVSVLFADHPDLLKQFTYFLPDSVQAQAKAQLEEVANEAERRKRSEAEQAIMHTAKGMHRQAQRVTSAPPQDFEREIRIPFGAKQGRTVEQEKEIIQSAEYGIVSFTPVRPPRRKDAKTIQTMGKQARPTTIPVMPLVPNTTEVAFFKKVKQHLSRKELISEKGSSSKQRHTPYAEFIKCMHLFGAGILNREELVLLLRGLFTQGHAPKSSHLQNPQITAYAGELLQEFEQLLIGRGPYAAQEAAKKDRCKYGALRVRDMDLEGSIHPTPSYYTYPSDFPSKLFFQHPQRSDEDKTVLNERYICVPRSEGKVPKMLDSLEAYDAVQKRHNVYEDTMARIEEDRFEVDMAIERNVQALRQIEPLAQEALRLRQREEKDGQPIGRLQYQLKKKEALRSTVINAIARVYGDRGDEVIQHLVRNPLIVLPIVYQRLKQKDAEWRKARAECIDHWNALAEVNHEGCYDVTCYFQRRKLERSFAGEYLVDQCKRAKAEPRDIESDSASFSVGLADTGALFFEPCVTVLSKVGPQHKDSLQLLNLKVGRSPNATAVDRERIGRILSEFILPWFGYPRHWVMEEARKTFTGRISPAIVKYTLGQRVRTVYGDGVVTHFSEAKTRYRVRLPFGTGHLAPSAILHAISSKETRYVRRDGMMVRDMDAKPEADGPLLAPNYQLLFGTRRIYLFMRLYLRLCEMLGDLRAKCSVSDADDPSRRYVRPGKSETDRTSTERLDYYGMMASLKKVATKKIDLKTFEAVGRKISKTYVHIMAAVPKLVDRCAEALISLSKEDALLHLYDYCQYRKVHPQTLREQCFAMAPDADFRIQYDGSVTAFSFTPRGHTLLEACDTELMGGDGAAQGGESMDADDPIEEVEERLPKRLKLK